MKLSFATLLALCLAACSQAPQPATSSTPASAASAPASAAVAAAASASAPTSASAEDASAALAKYHWQLSDATDASGKRIDALFARPDRPLQLDFVAQGLSVGNTCNRMHGGYALAGDKLTVNTLASTMMACPDPTLMALDTAVGKYLAGSLALSLDTTGAKPTLTLTTAHGDKLAFTGEPTAETRYGSTGETMFLEVAPATKPCNHPLMPKAQCLVVRELHYGANGVREGEPGAWQILGQPIDGYSHEAGVRNVLRVKRYKIANPPADASSVAYVLDMVVESETVKHK